MRLMNVNGRMNAAKFIELLQRVIKGVDRPVFLIVDGHPNHRAVKVKIIVVSTEG